MGHRTYLEGKQLGAPVPFSASMQNEERPALHLFLSPLTQGTLTVTFTEWARVRLIPAHAGNTYGDYLRVLALPAHPRAYGERFWIADDITDIIGSSPRIRGTRDPDFL